MIWSILALRKITTFPLIGDSLKKLALYLLYNFEKITFENQRMHDPSGQKIIKNTC